MNVTELLHKRILITVNERGYSSKQTVEEVKILEIAPSGNWIKVQNMDGRKYWKHTSDVVPIEILANLEVKPGN